MIIIWAYSFTGQNKHTSILSHSHNRDSHAYTHTLKGYLCYFSKAVSAHLIT